MLKMIQKRLPIELNSEEAASVQQNLQIRFNSLFHKIRLEYLNRLGLEESEYALTGLPAGSDLVIGELFMPEPGVICYIKSLRGQGCLEAGVISSEQDRDVDHLFSGIREAVTEIRADVPEWQLPAEYEPLQIEGADPGNVDIDPKDMEAARALMDTASRNLLAKIKDAGSIFLNKIYNEDRKNTEDRIRNFENLKLINKEYAVLCRRTGQQILRVADRSTIDESSQKSFKCFICGNPIAQEVVEEIATSNALCADMFNDNKWLLVLIQGSLGELGIRSEDIKVYKAPNLPTRLFLNINGQRYLLVLCTETLNLDQANLISAHLAAYKLTQAIIISTCSISKLMRQHLANMNSEAAFHFICDLNNLDGDIKDILTAQLRQRVIEQLDDISKATPVSIPNLVLARMMPKQAQAEEKDSEETETDVSSEADAPAETADYSEEAAPDADISDAADIEEVSACETAPAMPAEAEESDIPAYIEAPAAVEDSQPGSDDPKPSKKHSKKRR